MKRGWRRWSLRTAAGAVVFACIIGPAPGNVGGCGADSPTADPVQHCIDERFWECRRDLAAGRVDQAMFDECLVPIQSACDGANWPPGCAPTRSQSDACIVLLSRADLVPLTSEELRARFDDCNFCPGAP